METLKIDAKNARKLFPTASSEFKQMLTDTFGEKFFQQKITDRVKTFEDALAIVGASENVTILLNYKGIDKDMIAALSFAKLTIIAKALNEGWVPDWANGNQYKWYPYFEWKAGFGFSYTYYGFWRTFANVGSRLCFKSEELAIYAGKQFQSIYNDFLTL
jgi:hypothetical protein